MLELEKNGNIRRITMKREGVAEWALRRLMVLEHPVFPRNPVLTIYLAGTAVPRGQHGQQQNGLHPHSSAAHDWTDPSAQAQSDRESLDDRYYGEPRSLCFVVRPQVEHKSELTEYNARWTESVARATLRDVIMVDKGLFSVSSLEIMCEVGLSAEDLNVQKIQYEIVTQGKHKRDELIVAGSEEQDKKLR